MSYVNAGYSIGPDALFLYGIGLALRCRRWERALKVAECPEEPVVPAARS